MPIAGTMIPGGPQNQAGAARNFAFDFGTKDLRYLIGRTTVVVANLTIYAKVWKRKFRNVESNEIIKRNHSFSKES